MKHEANHITNTGTAQIPCWLFILALPGTGSERDASIRSISRWDDK